MRDSHAVDVIKMNIKSLFRRTRDMPELNWGHPLDFSVLCADYSVPFDSTTNPVTLAVEA